MLTRLRSSHLPPSPVSFLLHHFLSLFYPFLLFIFFSGIHSILYFFLSSCIFSSCTIPFFCICFYTLFFLTFHLISSYTSHFYVYVSVYQIERQLSNIGVKTQKKSNMPQEWLKEIVWSSWSRETSCLFLIQELEWWHDILGSWRLDCHVLYNMMFFVIYN